MKIVWFSGRLRFSTFYFSFRSKLLKKSHSPNLTTMALLVATVQKWLLENSYRHPETQEEWVIELMMESNSGILLQAGTGGFWMTFVVCANGFPFLMLLLNAISSNGCEFLPDTLINLRREVSKGPLLGKVTGYFCHQTTGLWIRKGRWEVKGMVNWKSGET